MVVRIPASCRASFRVDVVSGICLALGMGLLGLTTAVLRKTLLAPEWAITALITVQTGVLVFSLAWAGASYERRKVPLVSLGAYISGAGLILTGLAPWLISLVLPSAQGSPLLRGASVTALIFLVMASAVYLTASGFNALLAAVYRDNYPPECRAQILSWANIPKLLIGMAVGLAASRLLDYREGSYGLVLACGGALFIAAGLVYRRMPVTADKDYPAGFNGGAMARAVAPVALVALARRKWKFMGFLFRWSFSRMRNVPYLFQFFATPRGIVSLMRKDRHYARFQICQTLHGSGNLLCGPAYVLVATDKLKMSYLEIMLLLTVIPAVLQVASSLAWAPLVDRLSPSRARIYNSPFWAAGLIVFPMSVWLGSHVPAYAARVVTGLAMGGAGLMWTLNPLYYARPHNSTQYLAAHNFLTGTRGVVITLLGGWLYAVIGLWVFAAGAASIILAWILFYFQDNAERRDPRFAREGSGTVVAQVQPNK